MLALLLESSIRITLVIAIAAFILRMFGVRSASVRHATWTCVTAVMLLMPALIQWGPALQAPLLPEQQGAPAPIVVQLESTASIELHSEPTLADLGAEAARSFTWQTLLLVLYSLGATFLLLRLAVGMARVQGLLAVSIVEGGHRVHPACKTPITVGWLRPVMILPLTWPTWPLEQLRAVLAHEEEHILRRDPLAQWFALFNRAVFWFHPLAWWLNREIAQLAEEACDEAVLSRGIAPEEYSSALVSLARIAHENAARIELGTAMPGPALQTRLRVILDGSRAQAVPPVRLACMMLAIGAAAAIFTTGKLVQAQPTAAFEVAAIKLHPGMWRGVGVHISGTAVTIESMTVRNMLTDAYSVRPFQSEGGEKWIDEDRYDIEARAPGDAAPTMNEVHAMILALLKDRFKLQEHRGSKEMAVYALTVSPKGHHLKAAEKPENPPAMFGREGTATYKSAPAGMLATSFSFPLDRPIVDQTGLTGKYDYTLKLTYAADRTVTGPSGESLFTAIEEQLGLKLEPKRAQVETIVIDHVERPTEN